MPQDELDQRIEDIAGGAEQTKETIIKQEITKYHLRDLDKFYATVDKVKVTFTCQIPIITLSDLRETDLGKVIQFDCTVVGQTPKKLDIETGKYIQNVLIQETESKAKNNNPKPNVLSVYILLKSQRTVKRQSQKKHYKLTPYQYKIWKKKQRLN
jgi:predicted DNA-binding protein